MAGRGHITATAVRIWLGACAALPLPVARTLGHMLGRAAWWLHSRPARVTLRNLELAFPTLSSRRRRALARATLRSTGAVAAEMGLMWRASPQRVLNCVDSVSGVELLRRNPGRGRLILTPHYGNWELLNLWLADWLARHDPAPEPFTVLYDANGPAALVDWVQQRRARCGTRLVRTDTGGIRALLATLRAGGTVGLLPDQVPARRAGVHAPFFATDALTMTLVQRLLRRTGAHALFAVARRTRHGFALEFRAADGLDLADPVEAATALNAGVEACIGSDLAGYQWGYKRYKRPPAGMPGRYV